MWPSLWPISNFCLSPYSFYLRSKAANHGRGSNQSAPIRISQQLPDPPFYKSHQLSKRTVENTHTPGRAAADGSPLPCSAIRVVRVPFNALLVNMYNSNARLRCFSYAAPVHTFCRSSHESRLLPQRYEQSIHWATDRGRQEESRQSPVKACLISSNCITAHELFSQSESAGLVPGNKSTKIAMKDTMGFGPLVNICTFYDIV